MLNGIETFRTEMFDKYIKIDAWCVVVLHSGDLIPVDEDSRNKFLIAELFGELRKSRSLIGHYFRALFFYLPSELLKFDPGFGLRGRIALSISAFASGWVREGDATYPSFTGLVIEEITGSCFHVSLNFFMWRIANLRPHLRPHSIENVRHEQILQDVRAVKTQ